MLKFHQALAARRQAILNGEKSDEGFTLIELLIVVLIIGVLAAIAIPVYLSTVENTKKTAGQQTISQLATSITAWASANGGKVPTTANFASGGTGADADLYKALPDQSGPLVVAYSGGGTSTSYTVCAYYVGVTDSTWCSTDGATPSQVSGTAGTGVTGTIIAGSTGA